MFKHGKQLLVLALSSAFLMSIIMMAYVLVQQDMKQQEKLRKLHAANVSWILAHVPNVLIDEERLDKSILAPGFETEAMSEKPDEVRVSYKIPELKNAPIWSWTILFLAQPLLLVVIFAYLLLRKEMQALQKANEDICELIMEQDNSSYAIETEAKPQSLIRNLSHYLDFTQSRLNELELESSQAKVSTGLTAYHKRQLEAVLQTIPDAFVVLEESGACTFANQMMEALLGVEKEDILGRKPADWCHDQNLLSLLERYQGNVVPLHRSDVTNCRLSDNSGKTLSINAFPLFSSEDASMVLGTVIVFKDITNEIQLRESRDEFISHVSHELKSPLNIMLLQTELLSEVITDESTEVIESINIIQDEIERQSILINDLLNITKIESESVVIERQRVKVQDFLNDTFESATRSAVNNSIKTELYISRALTTVNIDKELFRVALNNLLSNALKYSNPGDTVSLNAELVDDYIEIQVSDSGIGISEADKPRIFDKFYRSESDEASSRPGHGLGLSLAKEIIHLHKAEITVESQPGKGTTFTIRLLKTSTQLKEAS
ncbi:MAG: PAS domain S-box protein [Gammaproteobacteria bacterium]|nr:PAS domain S-box protein [Gammaproteobacteria bacterium]